MTGKASHLKRPLNPMPGNIRKELGDHDLLGAYRKRPAYQQNDYLGWIARAKREETRRNRIALMLDELKQGGLSMKMHFSPGSSGKT